MPGWAAAGRLDVNSSGLLVLTQSGRVAKQLIGDNKDDKHLEKEYLVRVQPTSRFDRSQSSDQVLQRLLEGVYDYGELLECLHVARINADQLQFLLTSGKHHHIRRMCAAVDLRVSALKRVRIGNVVLGDLPLGSWRYLTPQESFQ
jgi:23S rRNA pseudouridine2604 synthase